jgi:uncharacterized membrane protein YedE/YeeE
MTIAAIASLIVGLIIGYLGQRSRMCFVGAVRDFILIRDTYKLKGLIAFVLVAWLAFPLATLLGGGQGVAGGIPVWQTLVLTALGGLGVGYISTLVNGCPFRQHVLAGQGAVNAVTYLAGFLAGAILFHATVAPLLLQLLP